jgi:hypothetical protein
LFLSLALLCGFAILRDFARRRIPGLRFLLYGNAFNAPGLIDDSLEQSPHSEPIERAVIDTRDVGDDFSLAIGRVDRKSQLALYPSEFDGALRASVEQRNQLLIQPIDFVSPIVYVHSDSPNRELLVYSRAPKAAMMTRELKIEM